VTVVHWHAGCEEAEGGRGGRSWRKVSPLGNNHISPIKKMRFPLVINRGKSPRNGGIFMAKKIST